MKFKSIIIFLSFIMLLIMSCSENNSTETNGRITIKNNDPDNRLHSKNETIELEGIGGKKSRAHNFDLILRAEVDAPTYNGVEMRATHVKIVGHYALVSYNVEGEEFFGGVDLFDVSDIENPQLVSSAYFSDTDVSAVDYKDGYVYLADHIDVYNSILTEQLNLTSGAALERIPIIGGMFTFPSDIIDLPSYAATGVIVNEDKVYVTTGDSEGGLTIINRDDLSIENTIYFDDARSIDTNGREIVAISGTPGEYHVFDNAGNLITSVQYGGNSTPESKSVVELSEDIAYFSAGEEGLKVYNLNTNEMITNLPRPYFDGNEDESLSDYVTNGVSINNHNLILIANGAGGIYVAEWADYNTLEVLGTMDFDSSTNYVEGKDNVIFVATGFGGLKILEVNYEKEDLHTLGGWDDQGLPDYLTTPDDISEELLTSIKSHFNANLPSTNPEFFDSEDNPINSNLILNEDAEVWLTFVFEEASWKNSLGYYYYDINNPPSSPEDLVNKTIAFPNTSLPNSGGNLPSGSKIQLKTVDGQTTFPAGTVIGFFLNAQGWNNGEVTNGIYSHYSNFDWNDYNQFVQQNVLLHDAENEIEILGFEDVARPAGDKDFDDSLFYITVDPIDAVVTDNMPIVNQ